MLTFGLSAGLCTMIFYALVVLPALLYRSQPKLKQSYCLEFSQCGIRFKTNAFDSRLQWQVYDRWLADAEFYILYHGKRDLSVIPRRAFAGAAADDEFRELLRHQIGPPIRQG